MLAAILVSVALLSACPTNSVAEKTDPMVYLIELYNILTLKNPFEFRTDFDFGDKYLFGKGRVQLPQLTLNGNTTTKKLGDNSRLYKMGLYADDDIMISLDNGKSVFMKGCNISFDVTVTKGSNGTWDIEPSHVDVPSCDEIGNLSERYDDGYKSLRTLSKVLFVEAVQYFNHHYDKREIFPDQQLIFRAFQQMYDRLFYVKFQWENIPE